MFGLSKKEKEQKELLKAVENPAKEIAREAKKQEPVAAHASSFGSELDTLITQFTIDMNAAIKSCDEVAELFELLHLMLQNRYRQPQQNAGQAELHINLQKRHNTQFYYQYTEAAFKKTLADTAIGRVKRRAIALSLITSHMQYQQLAKRLPAVKAAMDSLQAYENNWRALLVALEKATTPYHLTACSAVFGRFVGTATVDIEVAPAIDIKPLVRKLTKLKDDAAASLRERKQQIGSAAQAAAPALKAASSTKPKR